MRSAFGLSLALFALVLALNGSVRPTVRVDRSLAPGPVQILAGSKGRFLTAAPYAGGTVGNAIWVGDASLSFPADVAGIRVATLDASLALDAHRVFDVASRDARAADDAVREFERCASAPQASVAILATSGHIAPGPAASERLQSALEAFGAELRPFDASPVSYALISARTPRGWTKLAERMSHDQGTLLAFTLAPDLERYEHFAPDTVIDRALDPRTIRLDAELGAVSPTSSATYRRESHRVGGVRLDALYAPILNPERSANPVHSIVWERIELGNAPRFRSRVGLRDDAWGKSDGVVFVVRVDDDEVARVPVGTDASVEPMWIPLDVDLARFAGRAVRLELRVEPHITIRSDRPLWGEPTLTFARADE